MIPIPLRLVLLCGSLLLSSCLSTAVAVTAGTVKLATTAVTLPVKAGVAVAGAVVGGEDCEKEEEKGQSRGE